MAENRLIYFVYKKIALPIITTLLAAFLSFAQADSASAPKWIRVQTLNDTILEVDAKNAELSQLLDKLGLASGVRLHYSVLPQQAVTATCVGPIKAVLSCLLGGAVNTSFRYAKDSSGRTIEDKPVEVWLMGSSLVSPASPCFNTNVSNTGIDTTVSTDSPIEQTRGLMKQLKSKNADERSDAIVRLNAFTTFPDETTLSALRHLLNDKSAKVRSQALNALTNLQGEEAMYPVLQQALGDQDSDVRAMAISLIEKDMTLLQQATQDADPANREMAQGRLDSLSNNQMPHP